MKRHEKPRSLLEVAQQVEDRRLHRDVERRDRLVRDEHARPEDQRAREADALALAARQLVRVAMPQLAAQADRVEHLGDARVERAPRASRWSRSGSPTMSPQRHARVERRVRILEDHVQLAAQRAQLAGVTDA